MSSKRLQDMSLRRLQGMSLRRFQDVFSVTSFRLSRSIQEIFAKCLQDILEEVKLLR